MATSFDPYHRWLGIPPEKQPPNHYVLLALQPFEDDPDVIQAACDQRMAHLRTYQMGKHSKLSQKLLNEVAKAKVCLLNPKTRAAYDRRLREELQTEDSETESETAESEERGPDLAAMSEIAAGPSDRFHRAKDRHVGTTAKKKAKTAKMLGFAVLPIMLLVLGILIWALANSGGSAEGPVLVFDWPAEMRQDVEILVDGKSVEFPSDGKPLEFPCKQGEREIVVRRMGFRPFEQTVTLDGDERKTVDPPQWVPISYLVLKWPQDERADATLKIDGEVQDLSNDEVLVTAAEVKLPLESGRHTVWIARRGGEYEPFEQAVTVVEGRDAAVTPVWTATVVVQAPYPIPPAEQQRPFREQLAAACDALPAAEKITAAENLLSQESQVEANPAQLYAYLSVAAELAGDAGNVALLLRAVERLNERFAPGSKDVKAAAFARLVRSDVEPTGVELLTDAADWVLLADAYWDFAETVAGDPMKRDDVKLTAGSWYARAKDAGEAAAAVLARLEQIERIKAARAGTAAEARYAEAMRQIDALLTSWDFNAAVDGLAKLNFSEPDLAARLAREQKVAARLVAVKGRIIARIKAERPKKHDLGLSGANGEVVEADEQGITAQIGSKRESHPWLKLNPAARAPLLRLGIDRTDRSAAAGDWLAAGLLMLRCGDLTAAEAFIKEAETLGVNVESYRAILADALLKQLQAHLAASEIPQAESLLRRIESGYGGLPWFEANRPALTDAREQIAARGKDAEAEKLYAEAVAHFQGKRYFDLRDVLEELRSDYARTRAVTDTSRSPSYVEMAKSVVDLGPTITVRLDGKGKFRSIQAAIDSVSQPQTLIEIQDNGPYRERLSIPPGKDGLTLRGAKGTWPIVTSKDLPAACPVLVDVRSPNVTLQRMVLSHVRTVGDKTGCVNNAGDPGKGLQMRMVIASSSMNALWQNTGTIQNAVLDHCFFTGRVNPQPDCTMTNCIALDQVSATSSRMENSVFAKFWSNKTWQLRRCTILGDLTLSAGTGEVSDCLTKTELAAARFVDPANLDYRLVEGSALATRATDGGPLGCRYTAEMVELIARAINSTISAV